jgi:hypothetical protein
LFRSLTLPPRFFAYAALLHLSFNLSNRWWRIENLSLIDIGPKNPVPKESGKKGYSRQLQGLQRKKNRLPRC